jgi:hypothetical protein
MQNKYVGDIGDYVKLAILRALSPGYQLGVAWWLVPDEEHKKDGRHVDYLGKERTRPLRKTLKRRTLNNSSAPKR